MSGNEWRVETLDRIRALIRQADPDASEEAKWVKPTNPAGVPTWSHDGIICTGEMYKDKVKITFARGAELEDPGQLFNASLDAGTRRAIDLVEGAELDANVFTALIREAADLNRDRAATKRRS